MNEIAVVVPTYWTWPGNDNAHVETASYDHPTPLGGESTLPRLLDGLCKQRFKDFGVLILTGLSHPDLSQAAADHMASVLAPYRSSLDIFTCDGPTWERLKPILDIYRLPGGGLNLGNYSGIRNLQLLIPHIWGMKTIVALDDDEQVEADYLERAVANIGKEVNGKKVLGLAGPYLQADGSITLKVPELCGNIFLDKGHFINEAMRSLMNAEGSLVPSPMTLGGNMVFDHDCFTWVPFDPGITRGEDIDYLLNARFQGIEWWFDPGLTILHLPPKHYDTPGYQRMREDVFRFYYEREKLLQYGFNEPAWLEPYPGKMLKENLIENAQAALQEERTPELAIRFGEPDDIIEQARAHAAHHLPEYQPFVQAWGKMMERIEHETSLRQALIEALQSGPV
jgi:hypothetical protein